jgi:hypothetical protein
MTNNLLLFGLALCLCFATARVARLRAQEPLYGRTAIFHDEHLEARGTRTDRSWDATDCRYSHTLFERDMTSRRNPFSEKEF